MNVSVCMATYNGQQFLREQINSILAQLGENDELIIVDDASTDATCEIVKTFSNARIRLSQNAKQAGHVQTFCRAIALAKNDIIVLADQDDKWTEARLDKLKALFENQNPALIAGNFHFIDEQGQTLAAPLRHLKACDSPRTVTNILGIFLGKRPYYGCAMAFRKELRDLILPMPAWVESHDLWIAMAGNLSHSLLHCEESLLFKRQHSANVSTKKRRPLGKIILSRITMLRGLVTLYLRMQKTSD